MEQPQKAILNL